MQPSSLAERESDAPTPQQHARGRELHEEPVHTHPLPVGVAATVNAPLAATKRRRDPATETGAHAPPSSTKRVRLPPLVSDTKPSLSINVHENSPIEQIMSPTSVTHTPRSAAPSHMPSPTGVSVAASSPSSASSHSAIIDQQLKLVVQMQKIPSLGRKMAILQSLAAVTRRAKSKLETAVYESGRRKGSGAAPAESGTSAQTGDQPPPASSSAPPAPPASASSSSSSSSAAAVAAPAASSSTPTFAPPASPPLSSPRRTHTAAMATYAWLYQLFVREVQRHQTMYKNVDIQALPIVAAALKIPSLRKPFNLELRAFLQASQDRQIRGAGIPMGYNLDEVPRPAFSLPLSPVPFHGNGTCNVAFHKLLGYEHDEVKAKSEKKSRSSPTGLLRFLQSKDLVFSKILAPHVAYDFLNRIVRAVADGEENIVVETCLQHKSSRQLKTSIQVHIMVRHGLPQWLIGYVQSAEVVTPSASPTGYAKPQPTSSPRRRPATSTSRARRASSSSISSLPSPGSVVSMSSHTVSGDTSSGQSSRVTNAPRFFPPGTVPNTNINVSHIPSLQNMSPLHTAMHSPANVYAPGGAFANWMIHSPNNLMAVQAAGLLKSPVGNVMGSGGSFLPFNPMLLGPNPYAGSAPARTPTVSQPIAATLGSSSSSLVGTTDRARRKRTHSGNDPHTRQGKRVQLTRSGSSSTSVKQEVPTSTPPAPSSSSAPADTTATEQQGAVQGNPRARKLSGLDLVVKAISITHTPSVNSRSSSSPDNAETDAPGSSSSSTARQATRRSKRTSRRKKR